jgi:hypothetical protein
MNRDRTTIDWRFIRTQVRAKFGYTRNNITRSETWQMAQDKLSHKSIEHILNLSLDNVVSCAPIWLHCKRFPNKAE